MKRQTLQEFLAVRPGYVVPGRSNGPAIFARSEASGSEAKRKNRPPTVIRGANSHTPFDPSKPAEINIGYLRCTFDRDSLDLVRQAIQKLNPGPFELCDGFLRFDTRQHYQNGIDLLWCDQYRSNSSRCMLDIGGSVFESLPTGVVFEFFRDLSLLGPRVTRLDVSADDYTKKYHPLVFLDLAKRGNLCHLRSFSVVEKWSAPGQSSGVTCYFGQRGNDGGGAMLRVYDKSAQSQGVVDSVRFEAEFCGSKSLTAFNYLVESSDVDEFYSRSASLIGGCVDFRDKHTKPGEKNLERIPRSAPWAFICDWLGAVRIKPARVPPSAARTVAYLERCVGKSLARVRAYMGQFAGASFVLWLSNLVDEALDRISSRELRDIEIEALYSRLEGHFVKV